jgi:hypothetical protein
MHQANLPEHDNLRDIPLLLLAGLIFTMEVTLVRLVGDRAS